MNFTHSYIFKQLSKLCMYTNVHMNFTQSCIFKQLSELNMCTHVQPVLLLLPFCSRDVRVRVSTVVYQYSYEDENTPIMIFISQI